MTADIARVNAQAGSAGIGRFNPPLIMKMDVRHDRHRAFAADVGHGGGGVLGRAGDTHNVCPSFCRAVDLLDRRGGILGGGIGHGLHRNRGISADFNGSDADLAGRPALDGPPGSDRIVAHGYL